MNPTAATATTPRPTATSIGRPFFSRGSAMSWKIPAEATTGASVLAGSARNGAGRAGSVFSGWGRTGSGLGTSRRGGAGAAFRSAFSAGLGAAGVKNGETSEPGSPGVSVFFMSVVAGCAYDLTGDTGLVSGTAKDFAGADAGVGGMGGAGGAGLTAGAAGRTGGAAGLSLTGGAD
jgi:hypothetical protein